MLVAIKPHLVIVLSVMITMVCSTASVPGTYVHAAAQEQQFTANNNTASMLGQDGAGLFDESEFSGRTVAGDYVNEKVGFNLTLPHGWSGTEFFGMVMLSPGGIDFTKQNMDEWMTILSVNKTKLATFISSFGKNMGGAELPREYIAQQCGSPEISFVKINGVEVIHAVSNCDDSRYQSMNMHSFLTDEYFVVIMFLGNNTEMHRQHIHEYEEAISTLQVGNAASFRELDAIMPINTHIYSAQIRGDESVELTVQSTAKVSDIRFDEDNKRFSFTAEATERSGGFSSINMQKLLEAPYSITVDGESATDFVLINDEINGEDLVHLGHNRGVHEVVIYGTNVVPEFPVSAVGFMAALLGGIIITSQRFIR